MGLEFAYTTALSGLRATQIGIAAIGANIAGANNPNYNRRMIIYNSMNNGVGTVVQRATSPLLQSDLMGYTAQYGMTSAQNSYLQQANSLFGGTLDQSFLANDMENVVAAWQALQLSPGRSYYSVK